MGAEDGAKDHRRGDNRRDVGQEEQNAEGALGAHALEKQIGQSRGQAQLKGNGARCIEEGDFEAIIQRWIARCEKPGKAQVE